MATAEDKPIIAVAAEAREFTGLLRHAATVAALDLSLDFARRAAIAGRTWILAADGPGQALAEGAARTAARAAMPAAFLSTGFCGALDPRLHVGDVFVATGIRPVSGAPPLPVRSLPAPNIGVLLSCDRVAVTSAEKARLFASGVAAVEMEAAAVAAVAASLDVPCYCVRAVTDTASEDLPIDFNLYRDATGRFSRARIAWAALKSPRLIPGLFRIDRACRQASASLGDFLASCTF